MKHTIIAAAFSLLASHPAHSQDWATIETFGGAWDTNWGDVWVMPNQYGYEGTYTEDNGFFGLEFDGHVFVGFWLEDKSDQPCDVPFEGSYHWGRLELSNSDTYPGIQMLWGYCGSGRIDKVWSFRERLPDGL
jgi:hypothetical protein